MQLYPGKVSDGWNGDSGPSTVRTQRVRSDEEDIPTFDVVNGGTSGPSNMPKNEGYDAVLMIEYNKLTGRSGRWVDTDLVMPPNKALAGMLGKLNRGTGPPKVGDDLMPSYKEKAVLEEVDSEYPVDEGFCNRCRTWH